MIREVENDEDSITNKNLEEYDERVNLEKTSNAELTHQEQHQDEDVAPLINEEVNPDATKRTEIQEQYNQSHQLTEEHIRNQDFKQRNMEEFTNEYSISQVVPNGWSTFFNILSTVFFTFAVFIAICVGACLVFRVQIGIVPTDSMEPTITRGSLIFYKPIAEDDISLKELEQNISLKDLYDTESGIQNPNQILCYSYNGVLYVHRLFDILEDPVTHENKYVMVGDNPNLHNKETGNPTASHTITYSQIKGELVLSVQNLGVVVYFIKNNIILTVSIFCVFIFGIMLARNIIERNHAREEINIFIDKKTELEKENEEKLLELQKRANKRDFDRILQTNYNATPEHTDENVINQKPDAE